jgi:chromosome partitioning protein
MFVDTPGSLMHVIRDALSVADCVVLPLQPSPMDWGAQEAVADLVADMGLSDRTLFVINRAEGKSDMVDRAKSFFAMRTKYPIHVIKHRVEYARAVETGKAGYETNKDAGKEIRELWVAIQNVLNESTKAMRQEEMANDRKQLH